jgi:hypothetical protein
MHKSVERGKRGVGRGTVRERALRRRDGRRRFYETRTKKNICNYYIPSLRTYYILCMHVCEASEWHDKPALSAMLLSAALSLSVLQDFELTTHYYYYWHETQKKHYEGRLITK